MTFEYKTNSWYVFAQGYKYSLLSHLLKIGFVSFNTEYTIRADRLAVALEERGFESLWVPEHTHLPVPDEGDPTTGMPRMPGGGFLEEEYRHISDPFTTLAAAAAVTDKLLLGTSICLINQHHPINLAKSVATLDRLSDGRFQFGIGAGWYGPEMANHGVKLNERWHQLRERLDLVKTLWREQKPAFKGSNFEFSESWQYPKPLNPEGPPIHVGSIDTPFGREQVARVGDGWLPMAFDVARTAASVEDVKRRMQVHGRNPASLEVSLFFLQNKMQSRETIDHAKAIGADRVILRLPATEGPRVLKVLDDYANALAIRT